MNQEAELVRSSSSDRFPSQSEPSPLYFIQVLVDTISLVRPSRRRILNALVAEVDKVNPCGRDLKDVLEIDGMVAGYVFF